MSLVLTGRLLRENGKRIKSFLGPNHGDYFQVVGQSRVHSYLPGPRGTNRWKQGKALFLSAPLALREVHEPQRGHGTAFHIGRGGLAELHLDAKLL